MSVSIPVTIGEIICSENSSQATTGKYCHLNAVTICTLTINKLNKMILKATFQNHFPIQTHKTKS